jgi:hypothetical protein
MNWEVAVSHWRDVATYDDAAITRRRYRYRLVAEYASANRRNGCTNALSTVRIRRERRSFNGQLKLIAKTVSTLTHIREIRIVNHVNGHAGPTVRTITYVSPLQHPTFLIILIMQFMQIARSKFDQIFRNHEQIERIQNSNTPINITFEHVFLKKKAIEVRLSAVQAKEFRRCKQCQLFLSLVTQQVFIYKLNSFNESSKHWVIVCLADRHQ